MIKTKKILILGASGFIGNEVLKASLLNVGLEVYALEHTAKINIERKVKTIRGSLKDAPKIIEKLRPEIIIHTARISGRNLMFGKRYASRLGYFLNKKIYKAIEKVNCKLVYISGSLVYGSCNSKMVSEGNVLNPISFAKYYIKAESPFIDNKRGLNIMILRPGWVFGDGSWFKEFYLNHMDKKNSIPQYGSGSNIMSIIHVKDLARLILKFSLEGIYNQHYNIISPLNVTHKTFVEELSKIYDLPLKEYSNKQMKNKFGRPVFEALTSSIHLETNYKDHYTNFNYKYSSIEALIK